jgi:iron(III) transport system ATP-binding protein
VLLQGEPTAAGARTPLGEVALRATPGSPAALTVLIRPEQIQVGPPTPTGVRAVVVARDFHGHDARLTLRLPDQRTVTARVLNSSDSPDVGESADLRVTGPACAWPA